MPTSTETITTQEPIDPIEQLTWAQVGNTNLAYSTPSSIYKRRVDSILESWSPHSQRSEVALWHSLWGTCIQWRAPGSA